MATDRCEALVHTPLTADKHVASIGGSRVWVNCRVLVSLFLVGTLVTSVIILRNLWLEPLHGRGTVQGRIAVSLRGGETPSTAADRLKLPQPRRNSRYAFAALVWGDQPDAFIHLLVLVHSLRKGGAASDVLVLLPDESQALRWGESLKQHGVISRVVRRISLPASMRNEYSMKRWMDVFAKFDVFNFTDYEKIALLDTDMLISSETNADALFSECSGVELCMAEDVVPLGYQEDYESQSPVVQHNAGLMVVKTSTKRYAHVLNAIEQETHHYHLPEQQFIAHYISQPQNNMSFKLLSSKWNRPTFYNDRAVGLGHFMGPDNKPGRLKLCFRVHLGDCGFTNQWYVRWQQSLFELAPCTLEQTFLQCESKPQCSWCGHYCMNAQIACSETLFALPMTSVNFSSSYSVTIATPPPAMPIINFLASSSSSKDVETEGVTNTTTIGRDIPWTFVFTFLDDWNRFFKSTPWGDELITPTDAFYLGLTNFEKQSIENVRRNLDMNNALNRGVFLTDSSCRSALFEVRSETGIDLLTRFEETMQLSYRSDYCRSAYIFLHGGIYMDTDLVSMIPLRQFIKDGTEFATCLSDLANAAFLMSKPRHYLFYQAMRFMEQQSTPDYPICYGFADALVQARKVGPEHRPGVQFLMETVIKENDDRYDYVPTECALGMFDIESRQVAFTNHFPGDEDCSRVF